MDPVSDMFIRIKNAQNAGHGTVKIPFSKFKYEIAKTLERTHLVATIDRRGKQTKRILELRLIKDADGPGIRGIKLLSTPGKKAYISCRNMRPGQKRGIVILSTSKGVMEAREAKKERVGGQLIAEVW